MKRWLISSIALISTLAPSISSACAFGPEPEDYRYAAFLPFIHYKPVFATFNFCYSLYNDVENAAGIAADRERNIDEWMVYTNNEVPRAAIERIMYATSPSDFEAAATHQQRTNPNVTMNPFFIWLMNPRHHAAKEYMRFAKYSEIVSSLRDDPWEEDLVEDLRTETFMTNWGKVWQNETSPFLKERYCFQFLRLNFYLGNNVTVTQLYEQHIAPQASKSVIKPWAEEYYAMALRGQGAAEADQENESQGQEPYVKANFHLAQSFGACDDKKLVAVMYFATDSDKVEQTLALARTPEEKYNILAVTIANDPEKHLETLEKLYKLDAKNDLLEMLVTREINKCEDMLLTGKMSGLGPAVMNYDNEIDWDNYEESLHRAIDHAYRDGLAYTKRLANFVGSIVRDGKAPNKAFWLLANSYLEFLIGNPEKADELLTRHEHTTGKEPFAETALSLSLMIRAQAGAFDERFQNDLMKVDKKLRSDDGNDTRHHIADQVSIYVAREYEEHGNMINSIFLQSHIGSFWRNDGQRYVYESDISELARNTAKPSEIPAIVKLLTKGRKTAYETFLTRHYEIGTPSYWTLMSSLGSVYLARHRFQDAYNVFDLVPDSAWNSEEWAGTYKTYLNQNPFVARPGSNHVTTKADTVTFSKKSFAARMMELERLIADPKTRNVDELRRQYADAYFSMTYYGNSWILVKSYWSGYEVPEVGGKKGLSEEDSSYYGCVAARDQYLSLLSSTHNPEIMAHCCMMLARCNTNLRYVTATNKDDFKYKGDPYLKRMLTEFRKTRTTLDAIGECGGDKDEFAYWARQLVE